MKKERVDTDLKSLKDSLKKYTNDKDKYTCEQEKLIRQSREQQDASLLYAADDMHRKSQNAESEIQRIKTLIKEQENLQKATPFRE